MTTITMKPMTVTSHRWNVAWIVGLSYLAVAVHAAWIQSRGGLEAVPMILFGIVQYTPAILVLAYDRSYWGRLWALLTRVGSWKVMLASYVVTVAVMGLCIVAPSWFGHAARYSAAIAQAYPLKGLLPAAWLEPHWFWIYVLVGGPVLHLINAAGEEILWRGYLLDEMLKSFSMRTVYWLNGVLWGLWHLPMIAMLGWDFPGHPVLGVLAITASQVAWSAVMIRVRLWTDSLWPVLVMHAVANAMTIALYDRMIDASANLVFSPWGALGGALMATAAGLVFRNKKGW